MKLKKPKTKKDIENHPFVESIHSEYDGFREDGRPAWWVYMKPGYISPDMECGTIHEGTIAECCELLDEVRRATPEEIENMGYPLSLAEKNWMEEEA